MMQKLQTLLRGKFILLAGLAALTGALGLGAAVPASSANAAVACGHTFNAEVAFYEAGRFGTKTYTVPGASVSGCVDINVKNIQNQDPKYPNDHCAFFTVALFTNGTGSDPTYRPEKFACSTGPNGDKRPIALSVPNGMKYFVIYRVETAKPNDAGYYEHSFQIVD